MKERLGTKRRVLVDDFMSFDEKNDSQDALF